MRTGVFTHYDLLDVPRHATPAEIREAFRRKAHRTHPDKGGDTKLFILVQQAYAVLSDPVQRAAYDAMLDAEEDGNFAAPPPSSGASAEPEAHVPETPPPQAAESKRGGWVSVAILVAVGVFLWVLGDRPGATDDNGPLILGGWVFMGLAVAVRKGAFRMPWRTRTTPRFFGAIAKVALGIVAASAIVAGGAWALDAYQRATEVPLAEKKTWATVTALGGAKFNLATMWRDGQIFYLFTIDGYPQRIASARATMAGASFTLEFKNAGGFKVRERLIQLSDMVVQQSDDGEPAGLYWSESEYLDADTYRDTATWDLIWSGFPDPLPSPPPSPPLRPATPSSALRPAAPPPPIRPVAQARAQLDEPPLPSGTGWKQLQRGASKEDVFALLGQPSKVLGVPDGMVWYYDTGLRSSVWFDAQGRVDNWNEP